MAKTKKPDLGDFFIDVGGVGVSFSIEEKTTVLIQTPCRDEYGTAYLSQRGVVELIDALTTALTEWKEDQAAAQNSLDTKSRSMRQSKRSETTQSRGVKTNE